MKTCNETATVWQHQDEVYLCWEQDLFLNLTLPRRCLPALSILMTTAAANIPVTPLGALTFLRHRAKIICDTRRVVHQTRQRYFWLSRITSRIAALGCHHVLIFTPLKIASDYDTMNTEVKQFHLEHGGCYDLGEEIRTVFWELWLAPPPPLHDSMGLAHGRAQVPLNPSP